MGSQQFCLKWNSHHLNMLNVFGQLLSTGVLVDVTLACEGLSLKAHKMILSACSPFFQNLFVENPCKHPIVILKDISYANLKAVIEFMYRGEVNITHDQLPSLLKTAEALKVRGLVEVAGDNSHSHSSLHQASSISPLSSASSSKTSIIRQLLNSGSPFQRKRKRGRPRQRLPLGCVMDRRSNRLPYSHFTNVGMPSSVHGIETETRVAHDHLTDKCITEVAANIHEIIQADICESASSTDHNFENSVVKISNFPDQDSIARDGCDTNVVESHLSNVPEDQSESREINSAYSCMLKEKAKEVTDDEDFEFEPSQILEQTLKTEETPLYPENASILPLLPSQAVVAVTNTSLDSSCRENPIVSDQLTPRAFFSMQSTYSTKGRKQGVHSFPGAKRQSVSHWTQEQMQCAIDAVLNCGMSLREAAALYGVYKTTLWLRVKAIKRRASEIATGANNSFLSQVKIEPPEQLPT